MVEASIDSRIDLHENKTTTCYMSDVAREARVGTSTVSRVINGGARVSPETLERVRAVIRKFDYQPNLAARILKGERTRTIGLIIPSVRIRFLLSAQRRLRILRGHTGFC